MGDVVDINSKKKEQKVENENPSVRNVMIESLKQFNEDDVVSGIVLLMDRKGQALSGFFNTSFGDEAILSKTLDIDIVRRQDLRTQEGWE